MISKDFSSRHFVRRSTSFVIRICVSTLTVYGLFEIMSVIKVDLDRITTLLMPSCNAFLSAMCVINVYAACLEVVVSAGKRVAMFAGCSLLKPTAPVYITPTLGMVFAAAATEIITDGCVLSSMINFPGSGVVICDCAEIWLIRRGTLSSEKEKLYFL